MSFQHVDRVDGIFAHTFAVHKLHCQGSINHHVSKEVCVTEGPGVKVDIDSREEFIKSCATKLKILLSIRLICFTVNQGYTPMILEDIEVLAALIKHSLPRSSVPMVRFSLM